MMRNPTTSRQLPIIAYQFLHILKFLRCKPAGLNFDYEQIFRRSAVLIFDEFYLASGHAIYKGGLMNRRIAEHLVTYAANYMRPESSTNRRRIIVQIWVSWPPFSLIALV